MRTKNLLLGLLLALATACLGLTIAARAGAFARVTLSFTVQDTVTVCELKPGETPELPSVQPGEGLRFICWLDSDGEEADPSGPAEADGEFTALIAPELAPAMTPWLEHGELGRLLPEQGVTGAELASGVSALFAGNFEAEGLAEKETVTASELAAALEGCFAPSELAEISGDAPLTRLEAARILCSLGGFAYPAPESAPAPDLAADTPGAAELAACAGDEGAASYTPGPVIIDDAFYYVNDDGLFVTDAEIDGMYYDEEGRCSGEDFEPGFVNIAGWLYYVNEDGEFVFDETVNGIAFGPDGRYSSGNLELDALVAEVLAPICAEYETRDEMLRAAYDYARDSFEYLRRNYYSVGETGWEVEEAYTMFSTGRGNCYNYAAAFWALARGLGYDAVAVSGTMGWDYEPHGWVTIVNAEGERLTYDCETEMAYRRDGEYGKDMFAMVWWFAAGWNYYYGV